MRNGWIVASLAVTLAGCGGGDGNTGAAATLVSSGWSATDACRTLPGERVAALLGGTITKAELSAVQDDRDYNTFSQCSYEFDDGRIAVVGTGHLVGDDPLATQVEKKRAEAATVTDPIEAQPGVGQAAFYAPRMNMVWAFLGDGRYVQINLAQIAPSQAKLPADKMKADVIALAKALSA